MKVRESQRWAKGRSELRMYGSMDYHKDFAFILSETKSLWVGAEE